MALKKAAAQEPSLADAHFNLAIIYNRLGHVREAAREEKIYRTLLSTPED